MKIGVIGAGIVGVTSAYELAAAGHDVTVYEQGGSIAAEASFAHAGLDGPGCAVAWSPLAVAGGLVGLALRGRLPSALTPRPSTAAWSLQWLRANRGSVQGLMQQRLHRLAAYSRTRSAALTHALQLDFERSTGVMVVSRSAADTHRLLGALAGFDAREIRHHRLKPDACRVLEPGLNPQARLHAAVHLPDEGAGNSREFAHHIKQHAQRLGVRFAFSAEVRAIHPGTRPALDVVQVGQAQGGQNQRESFDAVLVCAGLASQRLLAPLGLKLPLIGVQGVSVTAPLRLDDLSEHVGPVSALLEPQSGISIVRAGGRVRASGGARIGRMTRSVAMVTQKRLYQALDEWFPGAARVTQAQHWQGASPTLPDGLPVLGRSGIDGVWLNLGHGSVGHTVACGSARLVAAMLAGTPPEIDAEGLGVERFR